MKRFLKEKKNIPLVIMLILFCVLIKVGKIEVSIDWIADVKLWINEFIMAIFAYLLSNYLLKGMKNTFIRELISFVVALFVSNSFVFDYSYLQQKGINWVFLVITILATIVNVIISLYAGYEKGRSLEKKRQQDCERNLEIIISKMSTEQKSQIYNCYYLIKKHKKKIELIELIGGVEVVEKFVEKDKNQKSQKNKNE